MMGCQFEYGSLKEKKFWTSYIRNMPCKLREGHKLIKLKISNSFLESFQGQEIFIKILDGIKIQTIGIKGIKKLVFFLQ